MTASSPENSLCKHLSWHVIHLWGATIHPFGDSTFVPQTLLSCTHLGHPCPAPLRCISSPVKAILRDRCPLLCPSPPLQISASAQAELADSWYAESATSTVPRPSKQQ